MHFLDLGIKDYRSVWELQKQLVQERVEQKIPNTLVLVEHPHVITKGRRSKEEDIVNPICDVLEVERGGEVTYHGPGQLVGYPIIDLGTHNRSIKKYMCALEEVLIRTLAYFDIEGIRKENATGVWTSEGKKIASIGVAVKKWVTYHGFALNVNTDLSYFSMIRPCGYDCAVMTSMQDIRKQIISMDEVKKEIIKNFDNVEEARGKMFPSSSTPRSSATSRSQGSIFPHAKCTEKT